MDANLLLKNKRYDGAYYLAGYAIECAFKACIAKRTKRHDFPDLNLAKKIHVHTLGSLLEHAGLKLAFDLEFLIDTTFEVKWAVVKDWSEQSRYEVHDRKTARDMVGAVGDVQGVLACIRKHW
jgi:HEPN domain-containing protein